MRSLQSVTYEQEAQFKKTTKPVLNASFKKLTKTQSESRQPLSHTARDATGARVRELTKVTVKNYKTVMEPLVV